MKLILDQAALVAELSVLQGIVDRKAPIEELKNVRLEAKQDGRLVLTATDLEVGVVTQVTADVEEPGEILVEAREFHETMRRMPAGTVELRHPDDRGERKLQVEAERRHFRLPATDTSNYPTLPRKEGEEPTAVISAGTLAEMIRGVIFTITVDDPRYSLGGALWEIESGQLTMVGTDGRRLALRRRPIQVVGDEIPKMIVPRKALAEIQKLAADHEGDAFLWVTPSHLFVQVGDRELETSLKNDTFPDYRKVIPENNDKVFDVDVKELRGALEGVSHLSQEQSRLVRLDLERELLVVSSSNPRGGMGRIELPVEYDGEILSIGFNAQYLVDFLAVVGTEKVRVSLGQPMTQGLFQPVREGGAPEGVEDLYIVMPMALPDAR